MPRATYYVNMTPALNYLNKQIKVLGSDDSGNSVKKMPQGWGNQKDWLAFQSLVRRAYQVVRSQLHNSVINGTNKFPDSRTPFKVGNVEMTMGQALGLVGMYERDVMNKSFNSANYKNTSVTELLGKAEAFYYSDADKTPGIPSPEQTVHMIAANSMSDKKLWKNNLGSRQLPDVALDEEEVDVTEYVKEAVRLRDRLKKTIRKFPKNYSPEFQNVMQALETVTRMNKASVNGDITVKVPRSDMQIMLDTLDNAVGVYNTHVLKETPEKKSIDSTRISRLRETQRLTALSTMMRMNDPEGRMITPNSTEGKKFLLAAKMLSAQTLEKNDRELIEANSVYSAVLANTYEKIKDNELPLGDETLDQQLNKNYRTYLKERQAGWNEVQMNTWHSIRENSKMQLQSWQKDAQRKVRSKFIYNEEKAMSAILEARENNKKEAQRKEAAAQRKEYFRMQNPADVKLKPVRPSMQVPTNQEPPVLSNLGQPSK